MIFISIYFYCEKYYVYKMNGETLELTDGPFHVQEKEENFPIGLTSATYIGDGYYLFFKGNKYCKRKLKLTYKTKNGVSKQLFILYY